MYHVGIDVGGTFTDAVLVDDDGAVWHSKVPTTPENLAQAFFGAIDACLTAAGAKVGVHDLDLRVVHGTTVATNAVVQRTGARVGLLTTKGFRDTIHIMQGRGYIAGLPDDAITKLQEITKPEPLVPKSLIREVAERDDVRGDVVVEIDEEGACRAIEELLDAGVDAFAVCFLWSFLNPAHEHRVSELVKVLKPGAFVSTSNEVAPTAGEYARTTATVINSYVGPRTEAYLERIEQGLSQRGIPTRVSLLQCTGGAVSVSEARRAPVRLIGSGPVGGTIACRNLGRQVDELNVLAVDMGGTTFDVSLIVDGSPIRKSQSVIQQYEYSVPTIDVQSIGSGGGSIVWVDAQTGSLRVGPHSAGAKPGPACYARGGEYPTVTDCDLVVGYLNPEYFLGGSIQLDRERAEAAVRSHVAEPLGMSVEAAALGALTIVDFQMAELMRQVTVGRGYDPRDFVVFAYGGAGPTHAPVFARELGAKHVVIPRGALASVWSAYGAVSTDALVVLERSYVAKAPFDATDLEAAFAALEDEATDRLIAFGLREDTVVIRRFADLKYGMQAHVVNVAVTRPVDEQGAAAIPTDFDVRYETIFGPGTAYRAAGVFMTTIRVEAVAADPAGIASKPVTVRKAAGRRSPTSRPVLWPGEDGYVDTPIYNGEELEERAVVYGPAVIELSITTIPVHPDQSLRVDADGDFILDFDAVPEAEPLVRARST